MDIQSKLGGVVKIRFYFGYKIDIFRDDRLTFGRTIQRYLYKLCNDEII